MSDNAVVYITDPSLLGSKLFNAIESIRSYQEKSKGKATTGMEFDIGVALVRASFMPAKEIPAHLKKVTGYAKKIFAGKKEVLPYLLARLKYASFVLVCVIEPGLDEERQVEEFLMELNYRLNGLLFIYDSIVDYDGEPLAGPLCETK